MANNFAADTRCIAYWRFEPAGLTVDSKASCNLSASTSPPTSDGSSYMEGAGSANFVVGSHQYYEILDANLPAGFPFKNGDTVKRTTWCLWFRLNSIPNTWTFLIGKDTYTGTSVSLVFNSSGQLTYMVNNSSYAFKILTVGVWYHVALSICGTERLASGRLYNSVDGQIDCYAWSTVAPAASTNKWRIGTFSDKDTTNSFDGKVDEVVIFNECLTDLEMDKIRQATFPPTYPGAVAATNDFSGDSSCIALWRIENTANFLADSKGSHSLFPVNGASPGVPLSCPAVFTTDFNEGGGSLFNYSTRFQGLMIPNASLVDGFPLKNNDATMKGTICAWIRPNTLDTSYRPIFAKMDTVNNYRTIWIHVYNGQLGIAWGKGTGTTHDTYNTSLNVDTYYWNHITVAFDGVNKVMYCRVWSEKTGTATTYATAITNAVWVGTAPVTIGKLSNTSSATECFYGWIDEVVVFNRMLPVYQSDLIRRGIYSGTGPTYSNDFSSVGGDLVSQYRFESGALLTDTKGTNTLTATASPPTELSSTTGGIGLACHEGTCAALYTRASSQAHYRTDVNLSADFPFKQGGLVKAMTVMAWVRHATNPGTNAYQCILSKNDYNASKVCFELIRNYDGSYHYYYANIGYGSSGQTTNQLSTRVAYPTSHVGLVAGWCHVTLAIDGINLKAYLRVFEEGTGVVRHQEIALTGPTRTNIDSPFAIGGECSSSATPNNNFADAVIDEVLVFNKVLSLQDVDSIRSGSFSGALTYPAHVQGTFIQAGVRYPDNRRKACMDPVLGSEQGTGYSWAEAWRTPQSKVWSSGDAIYVAKTPEVSLVPTVSAAQNSMTLVGSTGLNLTVNDVMRIGGNDNLYSVSACAGLTITLFRPYRETSGGGLTVNILPFAQVKSAEWVLPAVRGGPAGATISLYCGTNTTNLAADGYTIIGSVYATDMLQNAANFYWWDVTRLGLWNGSAATMLDINGWCWTLNKIFLFKAGYCRIGSTGSYNFKVNGFVAEGTAGGVSAGAGGINEGEINDLEVFGATWGIADSWNNCTFRRFKNGNLSDVWQMDTSPSTNVTFLGGAWGEGIPNLSDFFINASLVGHSVLLRDVLFPSGNRPVFQTGGGQWAGEFAFENFNQQVGNNFTLYGKYTLNQPYAASVSADNYLYRTIPPSTKVYLAGAYTQYAVPIVISLNTITTVNTPTKITAYMRKNSAYNSPPFSTGTFLPRFRLRYYTGTPGNPPTESEPMVMYDDWPSPYVVSASLEAATTQRAVNAFADSRMGTIWLTGTGAGSWVKAFNPAGLTITTYSLRSRYDGSLTEMPKNWTFEGSQDDSAYTNLDTRTNQVWTMNHQVQTYNCSQNIASYKYYRLSVSATGGSANCSLSRIRLFMDLGTSSSNFSLVETDVVMDDVSDVWSKVETTITPSYSGVIDMDLVLQSSNPSAMVWIDDINVAPA